MGQVVIDMVYYTTKIYIKGRMFGGRKEEREMDPGGFKRKLLRSKPGCGGQAEPRVVLCRIDKWEVANLTLGTVKTYGFSTLPFHSSHKDWVGFERNGGSKQMVAPCFIALER